MKTRKEEEDAAPSGSGNRLKAGANRRFRKSPNGNPVTSRLGLRPGKISANRAPKKDTARRGQRVLGDNDGKDDDGDNDDKDDDGSSSHGMFEA